jgi:hypothetical protein
LALGCWGTSFVKNLNVIFYAFSDQGELPRKLFPRIMTSPHLHDIVLKCNYINLEDVGLVKKMAEAGDLKKLEYFRIQLHKPLSELEKLDYELMTYSVFAFSPAFKYRHKCCTLYMIH